MHQTLEFVVRHGYLLLFVWILAEQAALPLPSFPLLLAAGALAHDGRMSLAAIVSLGVLASMIADNAWYQLGRRRGSRVLRFLCRIAIEPDSCVRRTESTVLRFGSRSLLLVKFVPGLSAAATPLAGISGMSLPRFLVFDTLGALLWISSYTLTGYLFADQLEDVFAYGEQMGAWLGIFIVGLLAGWIAWKFIQRRRFLHKLEIARITVDELRRMLDSGEKVLILDLRSGIDASHGIPGAMRIPIEELINQHIDIPRDRDIILFCS